MDRDQDQHPVLDPDPTPNIVLHPGDTFAIGAYADSGGLAYYRLLDRNRQCYAVLDCERNDDGWEIHAIRFVSTIGRRELLPVHPEPIDESDLAPLPLADPNAITYRDPGNASTVSFSHVGDGTVTVTHSHLHRHAHAVPGEPITYEHRHRHAHPGVTSTAAWYFSHADDPHEHGH